MCLPSPLSRHCHLSSASEGGTGGGGRAQQGEPDSLSARSASSTAAKGGGGLAVPAHHPASIPKAVLSGPPEKATARRGRGRRVRGREGEGEEGDDDDQDDDDVCCLIAESDLPPSGSTSPAAAICFANRTAMRVRRCEASAEPPLLGMRPGGILGVRSEREQQIDRRTNEKNK